MGRKESNQTNKTKCFLLSGGLNNNGVIPEMSPEKDDSISQMCQQLTQGLQTLTDDPFASAPMTSPHPAGPIKQHSMPATFHTSTGGYRLILDILNTLEPQSENQP